MGIVAGSSRKPDERHAGNLEDLVHKLIPVLPIPPSVAGVIEFNAAARFDGRWIAEQKVDVLSVDLIAIRLLLVGLGDEENIGQIHLRADDCLISNGLLECIGFEHRKWLVHLWKGFEIRQEPITGADGNVLAEPLFWFEQADPRWACFGAGPMPDEQRSTPCGSGILVLPAGAELPERGGLTD